jgi:hypothetical protein
MDFGIAETGIARGSPPGTTTEVLRFGVPFAEIRVVSSLEDARTRVPELETQVVDSKLEIDSVKASPVVSDEVDCAD